MAGILAATHVHRHYFSSDRWKHLLQISLANMSAYIAHDYVSSSGPYLLI
jgi:hypothetical protein